jgi:hypothetical protein
VILFLSKGEEKKEWGVTGTIYNDVPDKTSMAFFKDKKYSKFTGTVMLFCFRVYCKHKFSFMRNNQQSNTFGKNTEASFVVYCEC